ncbi:MAG: PAS domain S-box protein [Deltaproteobacteria bacterium]|nr:MAG: PAS domain S-box protein [Deltaproteobacteria bacterium]
MAARMRAIDWGSTPLGPIESWPPSLRAAVAMMLESRCPMAVAWGPELRWLYNDHYGRLIGAKHPEALGKPAAELFPEIWDGIGPALARARAGESVALDDWYRPVDRGGHRENAWLSVSYSPLRDETGEVGGLLAVVADTTARVEAERRLASLRELVASAAEAPTPEQACRDAAQVFERNPTDVPFALVYVLDGDGRTARRLACAGLPADHPAAPAVIALGSGSPAGWPVAPVIAAAEPVVLDDLPAQLGELPGGPVPEPCRAAIVLPLVRPGLACPIGVLVAGICPRRPLDDLYRVFFELAAAHIATGLCNAAAHHAVDAARRAAEYNEQFTALLGHELRNPLNAIATSAQLLQRRATAPEIARPATRIVLSAERMSRMIAQLLDLAHVRVAGGLALEPRPLDLTELCQLVIDELRQAHPSLHLELTATGALHGRWDGERLVQVVSNLVGNAIEHGDPRAAIRVHLDGRDPRRVTLRVENRGVIPPDVASTLFEPFRNRYERREHSRGLGLGLYISKEIVTAHRGTIEVRSTPEDGTSFEIELPKNAEAPA